MFKWMVLGKLDQLLTLISSLSSTTSEKLMALEKATQDLVDKVEALKSTVAASNAAFTGMGTKIAELQAKVDAIQPAQPIDQDDLDAIQKATAELSELNSALQQAVPANTQAPDQPAAPPTQADGSAPTS